MELGTLHELFQLYQIVTLAYTVLVHHIENNFSGTTPLNFFHPIKGFPVGLGCAFFIASELINQIFVCLGIKPCVYTDHNTLDAKAVSQTAN